MAGGSGTRLWPESRKDRPKQLLKILGDESMIAATVARLNELVPPTRVLIATTKQLAEKVHQQLPQVPRESILCEPAPRNTAPCIALAAIHLLQKDPDATMAVMPADHVIRPTDAFCQAIRFGEALVSEQPQRLVTFGIQPSYPSTSFGYIQRGEPLETDAQTPSGPHPAAYRVNRFREKPKIEDARRYLAAGEFYWNAGIFVWRARAIVDLLARFEPEMAQHLSRIDKAFGSPDFDAVLEREFRAMKKVSIDYAVMERAQDVTVVEAPFEWDDVGGWRAVERLGQTDDAGNLIDAARCISINSSGTIVRSDDPRHLVALVGAENLIVIVTPDATLIANKDQEESIRQLNDELRKRGWDEYL
jgi:mannose-1-phosphate guanylyltransferase